MKYQDYKELQIAGQTAMQHIVDNKDSYTDFMTLCEFITESMSSHYENSNLVIEEVVEYHGFDGFLKIVSEHPVEFDRDFEFWTSLYDVAMQAYYVMLDLVEGEMKEMLQNNQELRSCTDFINNPRKYIKEVA